MEAFYLFGILGVSGAEYFVLIISEMKELN